ncbi:MAG: gamma carbonic anhydrase family protein [Oscillospiraceae bacterium]|nr:gamma carbonic anhydrase family protein [Oscillospiraceae bacterium]MBR2421330.1 gamma carbonic anhydrase family protein [Oscillospiraceae bacterium]
MIIKPCNGNAPQIHPEARLAENVTVIGNVTVGAGASIWYGAVVRGDACAIRIGENSNVQDCCCVHGAKDTTIGKNVTIGHGAIVHGCTIENNCLVGMGATILDGTVVGEGSIIGAGALLGENKVIPPRSLVVGVPGKVVREVSDADVEGILKNAQLYVEEGKMYLTGVEEK